MTDEQPTRITVVMKNGHKFTIMGTMAPFREMMNALCRNPGATFYKANDVILNINEVATVHPADWSGD